MSKKSDERLAKVSQTYSGNKVPRLTMAIYPWSGIFRDACYALVGTFLLQYAMTSGVLSSEISAYKAQMNVITIFMMIALIWDGINDPIMGFIVEKLHFKVGKYKPWILIGAIGNALTVALMFLAGPFGVRGWGYVAYMLVFYFLWDLFFTINDIGYWSMLPSLTNDPEERASLTTRVTIATTIGAFLMNLLMFLLPTMLGAQRAYAYTGVVVALLFLLSQALIFFFCQEKERDEKQDEASEKASLLDLFKLVGKNRQLLVAVLALFLYYFAAGLLTGIALNYYYLLYGYGTYSGGFMATVLSIFYVIGTLLAQVFYPKLSKRFTKMQLVTFTSIIVMICYLLFFIIGFPLFSELPLASNDPAKFNLTGEGASLVDGLKFALGGTHWILFLVLTICFGATGILYLVLLVMLQNAIDYNEWKFGERKEAIASAWRPLDVKLGSALQTGTRNIIYMASSTYAIINNISTAESNRINGEYFGQFESFEQEIENAYKWFSDKQTQLTIFGVILLVVIGVSFLACFLLVRFGYKIDEKLERQIVADLDKRHAEDKLAKEKALEVNGEV